MSDQIARLTKRLERARKARKAAEAVIEQKSRELYQTQQELLALNAALDLQKREAEAARAHAEDASRAKSVFLANMSHELRTPLNAIIGYSELLQDGGVDEEAHSDLQRILESGQHLLGLIDDILDLSKVETGSLELGCRRIHLQDLVDAVRASAMPLAAKNHNILVFHHQEGVDYAVADPIRLRQVLLNLLSNACKFTSNGHIHVSIAASADRVRILVEDDGIGMDEAQQARLFQVFHQVHNTPQEGYGGAGLGLALTQRLCKLMGATLSVRSTPGVGSVFTVELQRAMREGSIFFQEDESG